MQLSDHFDTEELNHTDHPIANECPEDLLDNARLLASEQLEPMRILIGPLRVDSWFRCEELNREVGGEKTSAHLEARAADVVPRGNVFNAFKMAVSSDLVYDQIIYEKRNKEWIHIARARPGEKPRMMKLIGKFGPDGKPRYEAYHG